MGNELENEGGEVFSVVKDIANRLYGQVDGQGGVSVTIRYLCRYVGGKQDGYQGGIRTHHGIGGGA